MWILFESDNLCRFSSYLVELLFLRLRKGSHSWNSWLTMENGWRYVISRNTSWSTAVIHLFSTTYPDLGSDGTKHLLRDLSSLLHPPSLSVSGLCLVHLLYLRASRIENQPLVQLNLVVIQGACLLVRAERSHRSKNGDYWKTKLEPLKMHATHQNGGYVPILLY